ncbi:hypothetical protein [Kibdelosporangium phytohabitans]|nr:hypothetical protein [Kibdelosporangium phytohabitans]MBE1463390.1 hypothetical protein [Kibdelosporangium phytohabitans]
MDDRTDPTLITTSPSRGEDPQRVVDVWAHKAMQAGWQVEVVPGFGTPSRKQAMTTRGIQDYGLVDVEGLQYVVKFGPRFRVPLHEVTETGAAVERPFLTYTAWAEPVLVEADLDDYI